MAGMCEKLQTTAQTIPWQTDFVPPSFHIILPVVFYMIIKHKVLRRLTWLVDIFASAFLLYGTYSRSHILEGQKWKHNCAAALTSDYKDVSKYFILSIASWLSIVILDTKTCMYILKAVFGKYKSLSTRSGYEWMKAVGYFFLAANSVAMMMYFCSDVHQTFEHLTKETWFILYYWIAASVKVASIFIQGVFFCSWIVDHPVEFLSEHKLKERKLMFRMAFVNAVGVYHTLGLTYFHICSSNSPWTFEKKIRVFFLIVDFAYRTYLCWWYCRNSYCCLFSWIHFGILRCLSSLRAASGMASAMFWWIMEGLKELYRHFPNNRWNMEHELDNRRVPLLVSQAHIDPDCPQERVVAQGVTLLDYSNLVIPRTPYPYMYVFTLKTETTLSPYLFRRVRPLNCCGELVVCGVSNSKCLIMPCWDDNRHLLDPYIMSDAFARAPCIQEAQHSTGRPEVVVGMT